MLALRRAATGGTTGAVLLVLLATASIGAFSSAALVHLDRASSAAAWHEVGAAYQATAQVGTFSNDFRPADLPGVTDAALLKALQIPVGNRNLRVWLLALDLPAYERIAAGSPADPAAPPTMLGGLGADGAVPVLLSESLAGRSDGMPVGQPFDVIVEGYQYHLRGVDTRATFPTQDPDSLFIVASRDQLKSVHPEAPLAATTAFLDAPEGALDGIQAAIADQLPSAVVLGRSTFAQAFDDSPVTAAIFAGIAVAAVVAALYAALAVAAALALSGSARANEVAHLRMVGLSRRDALGLAIVEHGPTVVIAFVVGVLLGLGLFALLEPGLGMDALVGARLEVPLSADPRALSLIFAGMLAIAAVGIGLAAWMQRRGATVASLRRGAE
jgi:putative ABC transport system permease protein